MAITFLTHTSHLKCQSIENSREKNCGQSEILIEFCQSYNGNPMVMLDRSACTRAVCRGYLADCPGDEVEYFTKDLLKHFALVYVGFDMVCHGLWTRSKCY